MWVCTLLTTIFCLISNLKWTLLIVTDHLVTVLTHKHLFLLQLLHGLVFPEALVGWRPRRRFDRQSKSIIVALRILNNSPRWLYRSAEKRLLTLHWLLNCLSLSAKQLAALKFVTESRFSGGLGHLWIIRSLFLHVEHLWKFCGILLTELVLNLSLMERYLSLVFNILTWCNSISLEQFLLKLVLLVLQFILFNLEIRYPSMVLVNSVLLIWMIHIWFILSGLDEII